MKFKAICQCLVAVLALLGMCFTSLAHADKLADVLKRGYLIVGTTGSSSPFGFKDEKGELRGFNVDKTRLIANALFGDPQKVKFVLKPVVPTIKYPRFNTS